MKIHKGYKDFGCGFVKCGYYIVEENMAYHWKDVTCKKCLKYKKEQKD